MEKMPKVSILVPVYNHGKFIAQMLEGALAQQVNFEYEIVIGDDASTDNSAEIIQTYSQRYPQIKAYLHPTNLGPSSPRELGGKNNVALFLAKLKANILLCVKVIITGQTHINSKNK
jgi:glycosyltransferase involved in cell wall biosynthesis